MVPRKIRFVDTLTLALLLVACGEWPDLGHVPGDNVHSDGPAYGIVGPGYATTFDFIMGDDDVVAVVLVNKGDERIALINRDLV